MFVRSLINKTLFVALSAIAPAALATPPDLINVRDEVFGVSSCCLLTLRTTSDNLGIYDGVHRDVVLVVTDRESLEETQYPVYRVRGRIDHDSVDLAYVYKAARPPEAVDPFAVLSSLDGGPQSSADNFLSAAGPVGRADDRLTIPIKGDGQISVEVEDILQRAEESINGLAAVVGDYERLAPVETGELLAGRIGDGADCDFPEAWLLGHRTDGAPVALLRMYCDSMEGESTSILTLAAPPD